MKAKRSPKLPNVLEIARACIQNGNYRATFHAECRKYERDITLVDALHVIESGYRDLKHDEYKEEYQAWNYAIQGTSLQDDKIRVVISFDADLMLIITVINFSLGKDR